MADKKTSILLIIGILILIGGASWYFLMRGHESTDSAQLEAHIAPIAPRVAGYVTEVRVKDNQIVRKGDPLVVIDPLDYILAREKAEAELKSAEARLAGATQSFESTSVQAPTTVQSAQSEVDAARAEWSRAKGELARLQKLERKARSKQAIDNAAAASATAKSQLDNALARLKSAQTAPNTIAQAGATVQELEANVVAAKATLNQAEKNLSDTHILAPFDGRVTRRGVEPGAYVQPGQQMMALVGQDIWVVANFKETQLENMRIGQKVKIKVDAYPDAELTGKIDSFQAGTGARFSLFPPENATGNFVKTVQRVPVKITIDKRPDESLMIGPGMSVEPTVYTK